MAIKTFFDPETYTLTYVVFHEQTRDAVIIDPVLDFDPVSVVTGTTRADELLEFVRSEKLTVRMILETHAHADHLTGAPYLSQMLGSPPVAIGKDITKVQTLFAEVFDLGPAFPTDGRQFDRLLHDGETVQAGALTFKVLATPGHTPACSSYFFPDEEKAGAVFVGDALFMPDYGVGRTDFPGGSAKTLYHSIKERLYTLSPETAVYTGHDYQPGGRALAWRSTIAEQMERNVHLRAGTTEADFVAFREGRDRQLSTPRLLFASVQININAGHPLPPAPNGLSYLKLPLNYLRRQ